MKEEPMDIETIDQEDEEIDIEFTDADTPTEALPEADGKVPKLVHFYNTMIFNVLLGQINSLSYCPHSL